MSRPLKKKPSQVAQVETPLPDSLLVDAQVEPFRGRAGRENQRLGR